MVVIKFPDRDALKKGLGFLLGRSSGHVLRSGELIVSESAVEALVANNFIFTVLGKATYEQQVAAIRGDAASLSGSVHRASRGRRSRSQSV